MRGVQLPDGQRVRRRVRSGSSSWRTASRSTWRAQWPRRRCRRPRVAPGEGRSGSSGRTGRGRGPRRCSPLRRSRRRAGWRPRCRPACRGGSPPTRSTPAPRPRAPRRHPCGPARRGPRAPARRAGRRRRAHRVQRATSEARTADLATISGSATAQRGEPVVGDRLRLSGPSPRTARIASAARWCSRARRSGGDLGEHGVADEGVGEAEPVAVGHEDAGDDRRVERVEAAVGVALAGGHRRAQVEALAERRRPPPARRSARRAAGPAGRGRRRGSPSGTLALVGHARARRRAAPARRRTAGCRRRAAGRGRRPPATARSRWSAPSARRRRPPSSGDIDTRVTAVAATCSRAERRRQQRAGHDLGRAERGDDHAPGARPSRSTHQRTTSSVGPSAQCRSSSEHQHRAPVEVVEQVDELVGQLHRRQRRPGRGRRRRTGASASAAPPPGTGAASADQRCAAISIARPQRRGQTRLDATPDGRPPTRGDGRGRRARRTMVDLPMPGSPSTSTSCAGRRPAPLQRRRQRAPTPPARPTSCGAAGAIGTARATAAVGADDTRASPSQRRDPGRGSALSRSRSSGPGVETELVEQRVRGPQTAPAARRPDGCCGTAPAPAAPNAARAAAARRPPAAAPGTASACAPERRAGPRSGPRSPRARSSSNRTSIGRDRLVGPDAGQRRTAPQGERGVEALERLRRVAGVGRAAGLVDERREAVHVDLPRAPAAGRSRAPPTPAPGRRLPGLTRRLERPAQPGHVALQRAERRPRRLVAPQPVDSRSTDTTRPSVEREVGDDGALLRATELQRTAVVEHLDGSEHLHREHSVSYHDLSGAVLAMATSARPTTLRRSSALRSRGCGCRRSSMRRAPRPPRRWRRTAPRRPAPATARSRGPSP